MLNATVPLEILLNLSESQQIEKSHLYTVGQIKKLIRNSDVTVKLEQYYVNGLPRACSYLVGFFGPKTAVKNELKRFRLTDSNISICMNGATLFEVNSKNGELYNAPPLTTTLQ